MKIEHVLIHYLLKHKELTLENIGTFKLEATLPDTADPDKPILIPEDAISFQYNSRATEDANLIDFIVEYTGKIRPLAASDLESYLMLGRQFLNIGNPFIIPDIGTLQKTNSGDLIFKGGLHAADKVAAQRIKIEDEGAEEHEENMFNEYQKNPEQKNGKSILIVISLIIIILIIWAIWHFAFNKGGSAPDTNTIDMIVPLADSTPVNSADMVLPENKLGTQDSANDGYSFKVVVNEFNDARQAQDRYNDLKSYGRNVIVYTTDSVIFKVAEPFRRPLADTTAVLDSLDLYYDITKTELEY